jgi:hypothetical protein
VTGHKYDNAVGPYNAYGHCLELLERHVAPSDGVHLDLACGLGPIAEPVHASHGVHYVGVDFDTATVETLRERGFEAHALDLNSPDVEQDLRRVLDGRRLASISMLDGLEHLVDGQHVLAAISALLAEHRTLGVLSVPNVTHIDVGVKTLLGRWDYTETGLLDRTHYRLFSATSLETALKEAGLARVDAYDVVMAESDQHFPPDHGALSRATPLGHYLRSLRESIDSYGYTNQFVWTVAPSAAVPPRVPVPEEQPFLSVVMRTQGRRDQELREALLSLAAQSSTDFELLLIAHRVTTDQQVQVERLIEDQPPEFRDRIRLLLLDTGRRAAPLNHALRHARGRYLVILDDDDVVLENWVDAFARHEHAQPGRILRVQAAVHDVARAEVRGLTGVRGVSSPRTPFSEKFSLTEHIATNQSPTHTWAFPATLHRDFGMLFDETMTTTEDWEFLIRGAEIVGVHDIPAVLAIYQWWVSHESSRTLHDEVEWRQNHTEVQRRLDRKPLLLPPAETRLLRARFQRLDELENVLEEHAELRAVIAGLQGRLDVVQGEGLDLLEQLRREQRRSATLRKRVHKLRAQLPEAPAGGGKGTTSGKGANGGGRPGQQRGRQGGPQGERSGAAPTNGSALRRAASGIKRRLA